MNRKVAMMGAVSCLAAAAVVGGTFAAFRTSTEGNAGAAITEITTKSIDITAVGEKVENTEITEPAMPGAAYDCGYKLKNNVEKGKTAYPVYARVKVYKQWKNPKLDASGVQLGCKSETGDFVPYTEYEQGKRKNGWLVAHQDAEELVLYYTKPLTQGEMSSNFMDAVKFEDKIGNEYVNQKLNVTFEITAVQSDLGTDAIAAEWGVFPKIAKDGTIEAVSETK